MAAADRPRVFLDTNALVSALHSAGGPPAAILRLHAEDQITIVVSQLVVEELIRAIHRKLPDALPLLREFLLNTPPEVVPDPSADEMRRFAPSVNRSDAPVFAAAVSAGADYLVSGDVAFLREARRLEVAVALVTPRELLGRLRHGT
ncbi:MAG TPA: putative toxin-antitoxin system toxin component, PIN family [Dehalococcoidia bacterium]|nr:putative toxin-antitoxin system toxin component, PIN family [Dehalococcoidia bacterium]